MGMLASNIIILNFAEKAKLSIIELISLRVGFSLYGGWVTTATLINVMHLVKKFQVTEEFQSTEPVDDTTFAIIVLCIAEVIYIAVSFFLGDPLYALIFIWSMVAIREN